MRLLGFSNPSPRLLQILMVTFFYVLSVQPAIGGFDDGTAAYEGGDYGRAFKEFKKMAEKGFAEAQNNLGAMYADGRGVSRDLTEAVKWYRKAAEQGSAVAQKNLAYMYINGLGLPKDPVEAERWYRRAAEQGNAFAQNNLGAIYANGLGVAENPAEAEKWFRKAVEQGLPEAQNNLRNLLGEQGRDLDAYDRERVVPAAEVQLEKLGGVYHLPVRINGVLTLTFVLDTGASEVNISPDVASSLLKTGAIKTADFLPGQSYRMADGSMVKSSRLMLRELEVGGIKINEVPASIVPGRGSLLLGQTFLGRLDSWSLDNRKNVLRLGGS